MGEIAQAAWVPIGGLHRQWKENLSAAARWPEVAGKLSELAPKDNYFIAPQGDRIALGKAAAGSNDIAALPNVLPPAAARQIAGQACPRGEYDSAILVAGLDQGWLWDALYKMPASVPGAPGMKPPLFLAAVDLERLWVVLHYQNWGKMLGDGRVQLLVGEDATEQLRGLIDSQPRLMPPRLAVTVEPGIWKTAGSFEALSRQWTAAVESRFAGAQRAMWANYAAFDPSDLARRMRTGKLRILGITSRFTTFLQYSMRDWLASLEKLGHETKVLIEEADHERMTGLVFAEAVNEFRPDLIVMIDHCRGEYAGLPENVPYVMWVQDRLPHIYRPEAGQMQRRLDYTIGYGRQELTLRCGYPAERFLPVMVGVNEARFNGERAPEGELAKFACDVSFVSHATAPADRIVQEEARRAGSAEARRLLDDIFGRLRAVYDGGNSISSGDVIRGMIVQSMAENRMTGDVDALVDLFSHRVNNSLFRHQAVRWVAQMGVNLALYGNGWENHPEFSRFARGVAHNESQLPSIYQASAINLQVTPFGAVHQRLLDGLAGGGFFLIRTTATDKIEALRRDIWVWCRRYGVSSGEEMLRVADGNLRDMLELVKSIGQVDPVGDVQYFYAGLEEAAMSGFTRTVNTLWADHQRVVFETREQLVSRVAHFLGHGEERREIAESMRNRVLETHTYAAISRRMLGFLAEDLGGKRHVGADLRVAAA